MYSPVEALSLFSPNSVNAVQINGVDSSFAADLNFEIMMRDFYQDLRIRMLCSSLDGVVQLLKTVGALAEEIAHLYELLTELKNLEKNAEVYISSDCADWFEKNLPGKVIIGNRGTSNKINLKEISREEMEELIEKLQMLLDSLLEKTAVENAEAAALLK